MSGRILAQVGLMWDRRHMNVWFEPRPWNWGSTDTPTLHAELQMTVDGFKHQRIAPDPGPHEREPLGCVTPRLVCSAVQRVIDRWQDVGALWVETK